MSLTVAAGLLSCPICQADLDAGDRQFTCPARHTFDVARQGYVNLLNGPQPAHADTAAMLTARQRFLATGAYDELATQVAAAVGCGLDSGGVALEAGAGTGFYIARCLDAVEGAVGIASDISVAAARVAARAHDRLASVVADTWRRLPLRDQSADLVLVVFAPRNAGEFVRVLRPGGALVVVTPQADHLAGLREPYQLMAVDPDKDERLIDSLGDRFVLDSARPISYEADLSAEQVADLIAMGPNAFHGPPVTVRSARILVSCVVRTFRLAGS